MFQAQVSVVDFSFFIAILIGKFACFRGIIHLCFPLAPINVCKYACTHTLTRSCTSASVVFNSLSHRSLWLLCISLCMCVCVRAHACACVCLYVKQQNQSCQGPAVLIQITQRITQRGLHLAMVLVVSQQHHLGDLFRYAVRRLLYPFHLTVFSYLIW